MSSRLVELSQDITEAIHGPSHPFYGISSILTPSNFNVEICEALLKQIIDAFRRRLSFVNESSVKILAKLYDLLSNAEEYDEQVTEAIKWARCSQDVARQVREEEGSIGSGAVDAMEVASEFD
jgi:hypothetical protein